MKIGNGKDDILSIQINVHQALIQMKFKEENGKVRLHQAPMLIDLQPGPKKKAIC